MADQDAIREAIAGATAYLGENPGDAVATDSLATATLLDGLRVEVGDPDGRSIVTDMVTSVGGEDSGPSPGWLLRAALASCDATLIAMHAASAGIELSELRVEVDSTSNDLGILGIDESVRPGPLDMSARVHIAGDADEETLRALVEQAVLRCPVTDAIANPVELTLDVTVG